MQNTLSVAITDSSVLKNISTANAQCVPVQAMTVFGKKKKTWKTYILAAIFWVHSQTKVFSNSFHHKHDHTNLNHILTAKSTIYPSDVCQIFSYCACYSLSTILLPFGSICFPLFYGFSPLPFFLLSNFYNFSLIPSFFFISKNYSSVFCGSHVIYIFSVLTQKRRGQFCSDNYQLDNFHDNFDCANLCHVLLA